MSALAQLARTRWKTLPYGLRFTLVAVRKRTILVYDEQERRERTLPRTVFEVALKEKRLVYLGLSGRRSA
jgi:hypothetical protein